MLLPGFESPVQASGVRAPVTSVGRSKSSSLRRRKRAGRRATERQTSTERHNGEGSASPSGSTLQACLCLGIIYEKLQKKEDAFIKDDLPEIKTKRLFFLLSNVTFVFNEMVEGDPCPVVWSWSFVLVEVPTVGWSPPCCPLLSPYSCPASAEATSWRHIRFVTVIEYIPIALISCPFGLFFA